MANFILAGVLAGVALATVGVALAVGEPGAIAAAAGPFAGALANAFVGLRIRRSARGEPDTEVRLAPEARQLLVGWLKSASGRGSLGLAQLSGSESGGLAAARPNRCVPASTFVHPELFVAMETLAERYNRIHGVVLALRDDASHNSVVLRRTLSLAADEAMAEALRLAALFEAYPESGEPHLRRIGEISEDLRELAERAQKLRERGIGWAGSEGSLAILTATLDELRLQEAARSELAGQPETERQQEGRT
ncbi:MAG: hypothetical protein ACK41F_01700 [Fimbriimonadaceae bacterium]